MPNTLDAALRRHDLSFAALGGPEGLARLDGRFRDWLGARDPGMAQALAAYRAEEDGFDSIELSGFLTDLARRLEPFLADLFGITEEAARLRSGTRAHDPVIALRRDFVLKRVKQMRAAPSRSFAEADLWLSAQLGAGFERDREAAVARFAQGLAAREAEGDALVAGPIAQLVEWCKLARETEEGRTATQGWTAFTLPQKRDYDALVPLRPATSGRIEGDAPWRRRDGFALTDGRAGARAVQGEVNYCVFCHEQGGDFCSKGFPEKAKQPDLGLKTDPLGVELSGCPLEEKISEMNLLKRDGLSLAALAMAMRDNPMLPATGHRICNDCMKGCIYQKQSPVDIPQIETRCLTDVLGLRWGVEIYHLLTRWNPLRREQFVQKPDNGRRVLVAGMGPAGFAMAHHLTLEGCTVAGIEGLKIEPLPEALLHAPVEHWSDLVEPLDDRVVLGFGGVAEYGITVRWDKNFLKLIYLTLARRHNFEAFGGVRLGGTLTLENAWELGFDHVVNATGAGFPRVLHMGASMARGMRQANDFLMNLQMTGAAKETSLANLQVRLPALVVGGGLTGIDAATEVQAYYVKQVEKILHRHEVLCAEIGEAAVLKGMGEEDLETLDEFLSHGRAIRAERARAAASYEVPDFAPLLRKWGGVTVVYRKKITRSPAYTGNHEELAKAFEEGVLYAEALDPLRAETDRFGHVRALVCRPMEQDGQGRWHAGEGEVRLPARAVLIAAGTTPNTIYETEYPGTFALDGNHFLPHGVDRAPLEQAGYAKQGEVAPFTSYDKQGRRVSFIGDTHPAFNGSVVRAIASAKNSYKAVVAAAQACPPAPRFAPQSFLSEMARLLRAEVVEVKTDNPAMVELWIRAPMAARNFRPGQFFRLQSFESLAPKVAGTRLQIPLLTVSGTGVKGDMIRLMVLQWGAAPRLVGRLEPGDPIVLMGPTGAPTDMPTGKTIMVVAGRWGAAVMLDIGAALRAAGNRVLYLAAFGAAADVDHQDELEAGADQIIWCTARGPKIAPRRAQDISLEATDMLDVVRRYGAGEIAPEAVSGIPLSDIDRVMVMGGTGLLQGFQDALRGDLATQFAPGVEAFGTVGSPMGCMMKGVCAMCLQWQIDPETGERTRPVFSCAGQDQPLGWIDTANLGARQQQNRLSDRLSALWLDHVFASEKAAARVRPVAETAPA